jgi:hypothetical protein
MSRLRSVHLLLLVALVGLGLCASARAGLVTRPAARAPLTDAQAARLVRRSPWEPRSDNGATRDRMPSRTQLRTFRAQSQMPYARWVTGHFTGTTDEIIQWAAIKWGLSPDLLRAVAATESWWKMSTNGDSGDSFGLFQVRRPYHCRGSVCSWFAHDAALNADYYGAILRSYYDGAESWLNTVSGNGAAYRAGDLWGSVGAWDSGRWRDPRALHYISKVQAYLRARVWRTPDFTAGN